MRESLHLEATPVIVIGCVRPGTGYHYFVSLWQGQISIGASRPLLRKKPARPVLSCSSGCHDREDGSAARGATLSARTSEPITGASKLAK
jgi:hypothetical protein